MNKAIVALTRGYKNISKYETLLKRNRAISNFFGNKYPVVLFHEGDIIIDQQNYIKGFDPILDIKFVDISHVWSGGYEGMCRFQAYDIWNVCNDLGYEWIFRVDEDCFIQSMTTDPFDQIGDNVYVKSEWHGESHSETNATLPHFVEKITGIHRDYFYNHKFPYTNVGLSSVKFWLQEPINSLLKQISVSPEQRANRWGDLPVLGCLLQIYAKDKVGTLDGMVYHHASHNNTVTCK